MGHELVLNAIPPEGGLLARFSSGEIPASQLIEVPMYLATRRTQGRPVPDFAQGDPECAELLDEVERELSSAPGFEHRFCDLDRRYAWLEWCLVRAAATEEERRLARAAVLGEREFEPAAASVQGFPIRVSDPEFCRSVDRWLRGVNGSDLARALQPDAMLEAGLYKWGQWWRGQEGVERTLAVLRADLTSLAALYSAVVANREAVLVVID